VFVTLCAVARYKHVVMNDLHQILQDIDSLMKSAGKSASAGGGEAATCASERTPSAAAAPPLSQRDLSTFSFADLRQLSSPYMTSNDLHRAGWYARSAASPDRPHVRSLCRAPAEQSPPCTHRTGRKVPARAK
jgi:hypothetical protein